MKDMYSSRADQCQTSETVLVSDKCEQNHTAPSQTVLVELLGRIIVMSGVEVIITIIINNRIIPSNYGCQSK